MNDLTRFLEQVSSRGLKLLVYSGPSLMNSPQPGDCRIQVFQTPVVDPNGLQIEASGDTWAEAIDDLLTCPYSLLDEVGQPIETVNP